MGLFSDMAVLGHQGCWSTEWRKAWLITILPAPSRPGCVTTKDGLLQERVKISGMSPTSWPSVKPVSGSIPSSSWCLSQKTLSESSSAPFSNTPSCCKVTNRDCTCFCVEECLHIHSILLQAVIIWVCLVLLYFFHGIQFSLLFHYIFATSYRK